MADYIEKIQRGDESYLIHDKELRNTVEQLTETVSNNKRDIEQKLSETTGRLSTLLEGAPEDLDTFIEAAVKINSVSKDIETLETSKLSKEEAAQLYQPIGNYTTSDTFEARNSEVESKFESLNTTLIGKLDSTVAAETYQEKGDYAATTDVNNIQEFIEANKYYATIKAIPTNGVVYEGTSVEGKQLKRKDKLLVAKDGIQYVNGLGQVIFTVKMSDGYRSIISVDDETSYKNIKTTDNADGSITYKITKINDEIDITIGEEKITEEPDAYKIDFTGEHFTVKYLSEDGRPASATDVEVNANGIIRTYSRDYDNGGIYAKYSAEVVDDPSTPDIDETKAEVKPQVQFILIPDEGYTILEAIPTPGVGEGFKNDKSKLNGSVYVYKYTVIKTDLTVAVTTGIAEKTLADYYITNAYTKTEIDEKGFLTETVASEKYALKSEIPGETTVPTKVSELENDAGYLTEHQSLAGYATEAYVESKVAAVYRPKASVDKVADLPIEGNTEGDVRNVNDTGMNYVWTAEGTWDPLGATVDLTPYAKTEDVESKLADYAKKTEIPEKVEVPTKLSELENDSKFVNETALTAYALKTEIPTVPTKVSSFTNDAGYLTEHQSLESYALKSEIPSITNLASKDVETRVPELSADSEDGTYVLKAVKADGAITYQWVKE